MSAYNDDFKEIAHCGGQATFNVRCDADGKIGVAIGFRHSSPGPASWVGVYALEFNAQPVSDFVMGGIGQGFDPPMPEGCWPVFLGSDSHMKWGHQCPRCKGDFRNSHHPAIYPLCCPYCGLKEAAHVFLTPAQQRYVRHFIETLMGAFHTEMAPNTEKEIIIDMDRLADQEAGEERPDFYYAAESQQTRYTCEKCNEFNDIRGLYGYCAGCGHRNNASAFRTATAQFREDLNNGESRPSEVVRSAVSKIDACCRDILAQICKRIQMKPARRADFHRLKFHDVDNEVFKRLKPMFDIDLLRSISVADSGFLTLMLHRRHVYEHNDGVIDERYVRESGDADAQVGVLIRETPANAHRLLGILARMVENMQADFHEIFPLTKWPVEHAEGVRARRTARA